MPQCPPWFGTTENNLRAMPAAIVQVLQCKEVPAHQQGLEHRRLYVDNNRPRHIFVNNVFVADELCAWPV